VRYVACMDAEGVGAMHSTFLVLRCHGRKEEEQRSLRVKYKTAPLLTLVVAFDAQQNSRRQHGCWFRCLFRPALDDCRAKNALCLQHFLTMECPILQFVHKLPFLGIFCRSCSRLENEHLLYVITRLSKSYQLW